MNKVNFTDWQNKTLDEVLMLCCGGAWGDADNSSGVGILRANNITDNFKLSFNKVKWRNVDERTSQKLKLRDGDIVMTKSNSLERVGTCVIFFQPQNNRIYLPANFCQLLRYNPSLIDNEYGFYWLQSLEIQGQIKSLATGTSSSLQNINGEKIKSLPIKFPPIEEQRRIVGRIKECLSRVDEMKQLREESRKEAKTLEFSLLYEKFLELSEIYESKKLEDLAEIKGGSGLPKGKVYNGEQDITLLVKVGDMNLPENEIFINVSREFSDETDLRGAMPVGTVILPKRGGAILTNKKRILAKPALLDPNLMGLIANPKLINERFLYYWFLTFDLSKLISGSTVPQLNRKDLAPLLIPCPPLNLQEKIVDEFDARCEGAKSLIKEITESNFEINQITSAILRKAFAGEL